MRPCPVLGRLYEVKAGQGKPRLADDNHHHPCENRAPGPWPGWPDPGLLSGSQAGGPCFLHQAVQSWQALPPLVPMSWTQSRVPGAVGELGEGL